MILNELTPPAASAVPLREFAAHLRLASGFADDRAEDATLELFLRAATAAIEARIGKALIHRRMMLQLSGWAGAEQPLPVAPVASIEAVRLVDALGEATVMDGAEFRLVQDRHAAALAARVGSLPPVPADGRVEVIFTAGYGPEPNAVPPDLRQAVTILATRYFEDRGRDGVGSAVLPFGVLSLLEAYRRIRVS
ncbi:MAG: hypothetical protein AAFQ51_06170 [Pseudomonadota bacterium]